MDYFKVFCQLATQFFEIRPLWNALAFSIAPLEMILCKLKLLICTFCSFYMSAHSVFKRIFIAIRVESEKLKWTNLIVEREIKKKKHIQWNERGKCVRTKSDLLAYFEIKKFFSDLLECALEEITSIYICRRCSGHWL